MNVEVASLEMQSQSMAFRNDFACFNLSRSVSEGDVGSAQGKQLGGYFTEAA
jgi:predicted amino acid dehydrogenase